VVLTADLPSRIRRVLTSVLTTVVVIAMSVGAVLATVTATRAGAVSTTNHPSYVP
jgi:hypothetical protein